MSSDDFDLQTLKEIRAEFFNDATEQIACCEECYLNLENEALRPEELNKIFRLAHSMKSGGAMLGITDLSEFAHVVEDLLSIFRSSPNLLNRDSISLLLRVGDAIRQKIEFLQAGREDGWDVSSLMREVNALVQTLSNETKHDATQCAADGRNPGGPAGETTPAPVAADKVTAAPAPETVHAQTQQQAPAAAAQTQGKQANREPLRIDPSRVDTVLDLVGELVVLKGQLLEMRGQNRDPRENEVISLIDKTARELQERALAMRLTSVRPLMIKIRRGIRDLSLALNKPIDLDIQGEDLELDRLMIDNLGDPLMHLIRNAMDHGLECPEERRKAGKPETGRLQIAARQASGKIVIEIRDDGRGINKAKVMARAKERGLIAPDVHELPDHDAFELLFHPGFSTAEKVTDLSGRGVGLDVVRSNIAKLRGSVNIESTPGFGTRFQLVLPLTTAILDGILVELNGQRVVIPMLNIVEIVRASHEQIRSLPNKSSIVTVRGSSIALIDISRTFHGWRQSLEEPGTRTILILQCSQKKVAMAVDLVLGQSQVVLKSMGTYFGERKGIAGSSILGDGRVGLVIDVESLVSEADAGSILERKAA